MNRQELKSSIEIEQGIQDVKVKIKRLTEQLEEQKYQLEQAKKEARWNFEVQGNKIISIIMEANLQGLISIQHSHHDLFVLDYDDSTNKSKLYTQIEELGLKPNFPPYDDCPTLLLIEG